MRTIFISYRRAGTSGYGGRLQDDLQDHFGRDRVFRDIDSIRPGSDFGQSIEDAVARSGIVLALIGSGWLHAKDEQGMLRLNDPNDFVRLEIESALKQGIVVVPVLVDGARVPMPSELPASMSQLGRTQGIELSDERWWYDISRLVRVLEEIVPPDPAADQTPADVTASWRSSSGVADIGAVTPGEDLGVPGIERALAKRPEDRPVPLGEPPPTPGWAGSTPPGIQPRPPRSKSRSGLVAYLALGAVVVLFSGAVILGTEIDSRNGGLDPRRLGTTGSQGAATSEPSTTPTTLLLKDLRRGDCLSISDDTFAPEPVVACARPHTAEVAGVLTFPAGDGASYPGKSGIDKLGNKDCPQQIIEFYGKELASTIDPAVFGPSEASWKNGERSVVCILREKSKMTRTGSYLDN